MIARTKFEDLPAELTKSLRDTEMIVSSYLYGLDFIIRDTARDPKYTERNLLFYLAQDLLQSAISIVSLGMEGLICVAKRELRFVVESSIKLCFVQQKSPDTEISHKLTQFEKELSSQRISIKQNLDLWMLPTTLQEEFNEEIGRIYGLTSKYVHLTPAQIAERIRSVDEGRTAGFESQDDIRQLNELTSRSLAASLVLIFHSVPEWVAGDWLVEDDGATVLWYFTRSRYISAIDSHFDYKAERQHCLSDVISARGANVRF
jgi:hypothetical protein